MENVRKKTINGKPFSEIQKELHQPFENITTDFRGNDALTIEMVEERLDDVLGFNYSFVLLNEPNLVNIPNLNGEPVYFLMGTGVIQVFDDNGQMVCQHTQGGGARITYIDESGAPKDPTNNLQAAISDIKKKCAKNGLGIGRYLTANAKKEKNAKRGQQKGKVDRPNNSIAVDESKYVKLKVLSNPTVFRDRIVIMVSNGATKCEAVIWDKLTRKLDVEMLGKIHSFTPGETFEAIYEEKPYEGKMQWRISSLKVG